jgi:L-fucose isomerase
MLMLHQLSGEEVAMGDVWHLDKETNLLTLSNCGSQPTDFAANPQLVNIVPHRYNVFEWKIGACCPQHVSRPGKMTIARLARQKGKYTCLITYGTAMDHSLDAMNKTVWGFSPHSFIELDCSYEDFLQAVNSNHMHITYGDYKDSLAELCRLFEVEPIVI